MSLSLGFKFKPTLSMTLLGDISMFEKSKQVEAIAESLCAKFGNRDSYEFYCKVAYKLPEASIWRHYEKVTTGKRVDSPARLFTWLCKREMGDDR
jgi:hypothetical protein